MVLKEKVFLSSFRNFNNTVLKFLDANLQLCKFVLYKN